MDALGILTLLLCSERGEIFEFAQGEVRFIMVHLRFQTKMRFFSMRKGGAINALMEDPVAKRLMKYAVVIEKAPNNYSAYVPDLPGCIAAAETLPEVETLIQDAIGYHLEMMREYGDPIPEPQAIVQLVEV